MNILSVISSTKLKEINIKGFNGFFTLNNLYYSTNLSSQSQFSHTVDRDVPIFIAALIWDCFVVYYVHECK